MVTPAIGRPTWSRRRRRCAGGCCTCWARRVAFVAVGGLVRGADAAVAGVVAAVHRGVHRQQLHEPGAGLQRLRPRARPQPPGASRRPRDRRTAAGSQLHPGGRVASVGSAIRRRAGSRLFVGEFGYEIGWLLPAALLATGAGGVARARAPRTDPGAGGRHPVRRLAAGRRAGAELDARHGPPVLLPVHRAARRGDVRARRRAAVGAPRIRLVPRRTRVDAVGHRRVRLVDPAPQRRTGCPRCGGRSWCWRCRRWSPLPAGRGRGPRRGRACCVGAGA